MSTCVAPDGSRGSVDGSTTSVERGGGTGTRGGPGRTSSSGTIRGPVAFCVVSHTRVVCSWDRSRAPDFRASTTKGCSSEGLRSARCSRRPKRAAVRAISRKTTCEVAPAVPCSASSTVSHCGGPPGRASRVQRRSERQLGVREPEMMQKHDLARVSAGRSRRGRARTAKRAADRGSQCSVGVQCRKRDSNPHALSSRWF